MINRRAFFKIRNCSFVDRRWSFDAILGPGTVTSPYVIFWKFPTRRANAMKRMKEIEQPFFFFLMDVVSSNSDGEKDTRQQT